MTDALTPPNSATNENAVSRLDLLEYRVADLQRAIEALLFRQVVPLDEGFLGIRSRMGWLIVGQEEFRSTLHLADGSSGHEPATKAALELLIEPGDWVIDVGAHIGLLSLPMAHAVGAEGRLIAIEPNPRSAEALRRSLIANGVVERCEIHLAAASNADGLAIFYEGSNSMLGTLTRVDTQRHREVSTRTIDTIMNGRAQVSVVKIDAEGSELEVLEGMRGTIAGNPNIAVIAEFGMEHLQRTNRSTEDWFGAFASLGLAECLVIDDEAMSLAPLGQVDITQTYSRNLIFTRRGSRKAERLTDLMRNSATNDLAS